MKNKILFALFILNISLAAQSIENEYFRKIQLKLDNDKSYLTAFLIRDFQISKSFQAIFLNNDLPDTVSFERSDFNVSYDLSFMKHPSDFNSLLVLSITKTTERSFDDLTDTFIDTTTIDTTLFGETDTRAQIDQGEIPPEIQRVSFKKLFLIRENEDFQNYIYLKLKKLFDDHELGEKNEIEIIEPPVLDKVISEYNVTEEKENNLVNTRSDNDRGYSSKNNTQFLLNKYINSPFYYPRPELKSKIKSRGDQLKISRNDLIHLDINFSRVTFQHPWMKRFFGESSDNTGLSLEISTEEKVMNVLPWQGLSTTIAARSLFMIGDSTKLRDKYYLDTRLIYKLRTNTATLVKDLPFVITNSPKLNFTNRLGVEFNMTKELSLPYLNFYLALGSKEFSDPYTGFFEDGEIFSYFTMTQARAVMSFYWNTSGDDIHRFKIDIGGIYYDKFKVFYDLIGDPPTSKDDISNTKLKVRDVHKKDGQIFPMIEIHFNFVPNNNELFGISLRGFDNIGRLSGWLKLLDFKDSVLRFEATYITRPLGRKQRKWESNGGTILQFNYRYGM